MCLELGEDSVASYPCGPLHMASSPDFLPNVPDIFLPSGGIQKLIMMDMSYDTIKFCRDAEANVSDDGIEMFFMVGDEEFLPIKERYTFFCFCLKDY